MFFGRFYILATCFVVLLAGCGPRLTEKSGQPLSLTDLPKTRAECEKEWRDAWHVSPAGLWRADLGAVPENALLRVSVMPDVEERPVHVTAAVFVDGQPVTTAESHDTSVWLNEVVDLTPYAGASRCSVVFHCPEEFWVGPCEFSTPRSEPPPNVLVFLIDTLRQDGLGCYGCPIDTSPNLDAFAKDAVKFTEALPQSSWTRPSVASLLTSTYPNVHGAQDRPDVMRSGLPTLAKAIEKAGYETHGIMNNPNCLPIWGFGQEFNRYVDVNSAHWAKADDAEVVDTALATLDMAANQPWFLYVHAMGPHEPYTPPPPYDTKFPPEHEGRNEEETKVLHEKSLYDGEIAYTDAQFGRLVESLKARGLYDSSLIIVLSDHGEQFMEHGEMSHGRSLFEEEISIPLLVKLPGMAHAGEVRDGLVEVVDIAPTILDLVGGDKDARFQGKSFTHLLDAGEAEDRLGYTSLILDARSARAAKTTSKKYIHNLVAGTKSWYDLVNDPGEKHPLTEPPEWGPQLEHHTARMAMRGAGGFHLLLTGGENSFNTVTGTIKGEGFGDVELQYPEVSGHMERDGDTVTFEVKMEDLRFTLHNAHLWFGALEQNHAHLHIHAPLDSELTVTLKSNGKPIDPEEISIGSEGKHRPLRRAVLRMKDMLADPDAFDPTVLPSKFAVYIWYVADTETVADEELDPQVRDALRALGYMQ